jgi:tripartite-type tricarboxylate transporter receptor subunit TctC
MKVLHLAAVAIAAACTALPAAQAQSYPARPVKMVVPFSAGGPADNYARFLAQRLQESLGQSFVVDNKPGAGSVIGTDFVSKAAPDGYTLLVMSNTQTVNESLIPNKPYALMRDFVGVAPINYSDLVLVAHPGSGISSIADLIKRAKADPDKLNYASSGPGTPYHMAGELFKSMAKVSITHVPYKGSAGARTDVLGGQVEMMFDAVTTMADQAKAGKVRALATTGRQRSDVMPDVPTVAETIPGFQMTTWYGLMAPAGTSPDIVSKLQSEVALILKNPEIASRMRDNGLVPEGSTSQSFAELIKGDLSRWSAAVKAADIKD